MSQPSSPNDDDEQPSDSRRWNITRRGYVQSLAAAGLVALTGYSLEDIIDEYDVNSEMLNSDRFDIVYDAREEMASRVRQPMPDHPVVLENDRIDGNYGRFTKSLQHNDDGSVDDDVYESLIRALHTGEMSDLTDVERGGDRKLVDPLASYSMPVMGMDTHEEEMTPPPDMDSEQTAAELAELYWQSLLRDVPFENYDDNDLAQQAAEELSDYGALPAPRNDDGDITPDLLFRGHLDGSTTGPFVSQWLLKDAQYGAQNIEQMIRVEQSGINYVNDRDVWLSNMNGTSLDQDDSSVASVKEQQFEEEPQYIHSGRDMLSCVHRDVVPGQFLLAALILIERPIDGVPPDQEEIFNDGNPYNSNPAAISYVNHSRTEQLDLMTRAARHALMSAWFQKWQVHRRARPEKLAGLIDLTLNPSTDVDHQDLFDDSIFEADVLDVVYDEQGNYLLSQAFSEGAPTHPSYPGGHATVAAAAGTVLKALFNEDYVIPNPVVPSEDGSEIQPYEGDEELTVLSETHKLMDNMNFAGRQMSGVHYRSDTIQSYELGEQVAIRTLQDAKMQSYEDADWEFTSLSGSTVSI